MSEEVLKPCAYCGSPSETYESSGWGWYPQCMGENCEIDPISEEAFSTEAEAITAWNTRPGEQAAYEAGRAAGRVEERERVVAALEEYLQGWKRHIPEGGGSRFFGYGAQQALQEVIAIAREEGG